MLSHVKACIIESEKNKTLFSDEREHMRENSIYIHETSKLLREMGGSWAKIIYGVATALYYLQKCKKAEKSIDKIIISCYNEKNERMFLMETKAPRELIKKDGEGAGEKWKREQ